MGKAEMLRAYAEEGLVDIADGAARQDEKKNSTEDSWM